MPFLDATTNGDTASNPLPTVPLWIAGKAHNADSSTSKQSIQPIISAASNKHIHNFVSATPAQATLACDSAATTLQAWRQTTPAHRRNILLKVADEYERRLNEIAEMQTAETSCPLEFAKWNIAVAAKYIREIAAATAEIRGVVPQRDSDESGVGKEGLTIVNMEPVGVVMVIPPWNGAVILPTRALTMVLAAGCTVVLKSSEKCPMTHHLLVECYEKAGVPAGVINAIQVGREQAAEVTEAIISHKAVRKVDFIGSAGVGRMIGQLAAKYLKPVLMELGGKGPALILEDANLEKAAKICALGAILHHGQLCFSTERIIVLKGIADKFVPLLKAAFEEIPGAGTAVDTVSSKHAYDVLVDAKEHGAKFLVGGPEYIGEKDLKISLRPSLVTEIPKDARIRDEETFGPSASVYVADDEAEAVKLANDSAYGLNAAVHSSSWERAFKVAKQLEYGQVLINQMTAGDAPGQPIRGVKGSGWGTSNSIWGIKEFLVEKTISFASAEGSKIAIA